VASARSGSVDTSAKDASRPDITSIAIWAAGVGLALTATALRPRGFASSLRTTAGPFATVGAVVVGGWLLVRSGWFGRACAPIPRMRPATAVASVLLVTALTAGVVNLDVAVVVGVPLALVTASATGVSAGWLAIGVANMANAGSFLLPTSNVTNLLVMGPEIPGPVTFVRASWLAWLVVVTLTTAAVTWWTLRADVEPRPRAADRPWSLRWLTLDLAAMLLLASGLRTLVAGGIALPGTFATQASFGALLASTFDNLPVASLVHAGADPWAAVLAMGAGSSLLVVGSVATVVARRIARDGGARFTAGRVALIGLALLPLQLTAAYLGLRLTGAI
jgi:arsenical pump membrane protein